MPDLYHTLLKYDIGHLKIIADFWGLEMKSREVQPATEEICAALLVPIVVEETIEILPASARAALAELARAGGKMERGLFSRTFGEIREMGTGRRDRETPYLKPASPGEILFYRGLLAKAFFDSDRGALEYVYIPDDLLPLIGRAGDTAATEALGRLATPTERTYELPTSDRVLDDATTYLAALRLDLESSDIPAQLQEQAPTLQKLLSSAKLIRKNGVQAEAARDFLEDSRENALEKLYTAWVESDSFDELRLIPEIICEGEWRNSPHEIRQLVLSFLQALPREQWWSMPAFLHDLKTRHPDFQRPAGDYDSWFIKRKSDGKYLRGFAYWDEVDGAVVKAIVRMLHLLGGADLACPEEGGALTAFRLRTPRGTAVETGKLGIGSNGKLRVPRLFPRAVRYQLARFCEWADGKPDEYEYQLSARSLQRAHRQGLKAEQLLSLLVKHTSGKVPPALVKALRRWDAHGSEARVASLSVLRVDRAEVIVEIRKSKAGKFLGELLSPTAVVIKAGAIQKVVAALAELGLLAETEIQE